MSDINKQFDLGNALLFTQIDRIQRAGKNATFALLRTLVDQVIRRNDAQNYMVFGDPAARIRIGDD